MMVKDSIGYLLFNLFLAVNLKLLAKAIILFILSTEVSKSSLIKEGLNSGIFTKCTDYSL